MLQGVLGQNPPLRVDDKHLLHQVFELHELPFVVGLSRVLQKREQILGWLAVLDDCNLGLQKQSQQMLW